MPAGISEQLLAKAYGPTDLSGFYNAIDNASKQLLAQEREYRRQYLNQYSKELATLQQTKGVKNFDLPEIQQYISNWKGSSMQLMSNKNLIDRDTKKYVELKTGQENSLITAQQKIANSQAAVKEEEDMVKEMRTHPERFRPNALDEYINNVVNKPTSYSSSTKVKSGNNEYTLRDRQLYLNPLEGYGDWFDKLQQGFNYSKGTKYLETEPDKNGVKKVTEFANIPNYRIGQSNVVNKFNSIEDPNKKFGFADKVLSEAKDYATVVNTFGKIRKELKTKGLTDSDIGIIGDENEILLSPNLDEEVAKKGKAETASKYLAMKHFVDEASRINEKPTKESIGIMQEMELKRKNALEMIDVRARKALSNQKQMENIRYANKLNLIGAIDKGSLKVDAVFDAISKGGQKGYEAADNLVNFINTQSFVDQNAVLVSSSIKDGAFSKSNDVIADLKLGKKESEDPTKIAEAMNQKNKDIGILPRVNVSSLTSGKVIALTWVEDGVQRQAFLDAQDKDSKNWMQKRVNKELQTRKQKAAMAEDFFSGSIDIDGF